MFYLIFDKGKKDEARWSWKLLDDKSKEIGESKVLFTKGEIISLIKRIKNEVSSAQIFDADNLKDNKGLCFLYYKSENSWYWDLKLEKEKIANGIIPDDIFKGQNVGDTAEGWVKQIREIMQKAEIKWEDEKDDPAYQDKIGDGTETKGIPGS